MKKIIALFLALTISFQTLCVVSYAGGEEYTGEILAAINTSFTENGTFSAFRKYGEKSEKNEDNNYLSSDVSERDNIGFDVIDDDEPLSPEEAALLEAAEGSSKNETQAKASYKVGDEKKIDMDINVRCVYIGKNCTVWTQIEDTDKYNYLTDNECIELGKWFDDMIPVELELFGDRRIDTDKDGKIAVFFHDMENKGGFVQYSDFIGKNGKTGNVWQSLLASSFSIHCDCIHVDRQYGMDFSKSTMVHEYQHYIHFSYGYAGKTNRTYFKHDNSAVTEGFSTASEYILCDSSYMFERYTHEYGLFHWNNPMSLAEPYNLEFTFFQYVRTRYAQLTGDTSEKYPGKYVYKTILEKMSKDSSDGFRIAADLLYPEKDYPGLTTTDERLRQLVIDFWSAVILQEDTGIYGFNGDRIVRDFYIDIKELSDCSNDVLYPGTAEFYRINGDFGGTAVVTEKSSDDMVFIAFSGFDIRLFYKNNDGDYIFCNQFYSYNEGKTPENYFYYNESLLGWNIEGKEYKSNNTFKTNKSDEKYKDVYAFPITEPGEKIDCGEYIFDGIKYDTKCYIFKPDVSGLYRVSCSSDEYIFEPDEDGEYHRIDWSYVNEYIYYYLYENIEYNIFCDGLYISECDCPDISFSIDYQNKAYNLTLDYNGIAERDNEILSFSDRYIIDDDWSLYNCFDYERFLYGWGRDKNSVVPDYEFLEEVILTEDTTLYAVWKDIPEVKEGTFSAEKNAYYLFKPEKSGVYKFETDGQTEAEIIWCTAFTDNFARAVASFYSSQNRPALVTLEAGQTCLVVSTSTASLTITELAENAKNNITYHTGEYMDFTINESVNHTVISFEPDSIIIGCEFLGWATSENADEAEYHAGDTIPSTYDVDLYAVWKIKPYSQNLSLAVKGILLYLRLPVSLIKNLIFYLKISLIPNAETSFSYGDDVKMYNLIKYLNS